MRHQMGECDERLHKGHWHYITDGYNDEEVDVYVPVVDYPGPTPDPTADDDELCPASQSQSGIPFSDCHPQFKEYLLKVHGCNIDTCNCVHCGNLDPDLVRELCHNPGLGL